MSAKGYLGPEGVARLMRKGYYSPNGVARKLVKAYCSPDGVARLAWEAGGRVRAYLYNGVKLPELLPAPEGYHHACIVKGTWSGLYTLAFLPSLAFANISDKWSVDLSCGYVRATYQVGHPSYDGWSSLREETSSGLGIVVGNILWANFDVLNEDGSTLLEASDPVPLYSYKGVELPELPELTYPYAFITYFSNGDKYYLYVLAEQATITVIYMGGGAEAGKAKLKYCYNGNAWDNPTDETANSVIGTAYCKPIWSNYEMLDNHGSLYLSASDPQPVYF